MTDCPAVEDICDTGDELEVDFRSGFFINHTRGISREYPGIPESLQDIVRLGGNAGWLREWWSQRQQGAPETAQGNRR
jgi:3-isopropylmalate/(R)-2-methylmalate dehydratase small subunit